MVATRESDSVGFLSCTVLPSSHAASRDPVEPVQETREWSSFAPFSKQLEELPDSVRDWFVQLTSGPSRVVVRQSYVYVSR